MSNKPNFRAPVVLSEFIEKRRDEASITVEIPDADPLVIPPPDLWPAEAFGIPLKQRNAERTWRAVLGDAEYDRFAASLPGLGVTTPAGIVIDQIYNDATTAKQGVAPGE